MTDYRKYINALRKCAKEHESDRTSTGHIIVSDLCRDTANLLEQIEQESKTGYISIDAAMSVFDDFMCGGKSMKMGRKHEKMTKLQYLIITRIIPSFLHSPDELREIANEYEKLFNSDLKEDWFTIKDANDNIWGRNHEK